MSDNSSLDEFNLQVKDPRKTYFVILIVILVAGAAFGLGRLSKIEEGRVPIEFSQWQSTSTPSVLGAVSDTSVPTKSGKFVGSKNSNLYHFPWCPGALRIKEGNKIWFNSREAAETAGYSPAANCKGL